MDVTTSCNHTHHVKVNLTQAESFLVPATYRGGKDTLVTTVTAASDGRPLAHVNVGGWYAKKDGTPSSVRASYPPRVALADLPEPVRAAILNAFQEASHG